MGESSTDAPQGGGRGQVGHVPVLLKEAIDFLAVRRGGTYIDATAGLGGHSHEIAKRLGARGHLIGLDKDPQALEIARRTLQPSSSRAEMEDSPSESSAGVEGSAVADWPEITLLHRSFAEIAKGEPAATIDGILADLGVSSLQLDNAARGFSFQADGPLDMRMDPRSERTAEQVVNHLDERRACRCDLRIRRGKEVAENRQSHLPVAADTNYRTTCGCHISRGPANESRPNVGFIPRPELFRLFESS